MGFRAPLQILLWLFNHRLNSFHFHDSCKLIDYFSPFSAYAEFPYSRFWRLILRAQYIARAIFTCLTVIVVTLLCAIKKKKKLSKTK